MMRTPRKGESSFDASDTSADVENLDLYEGSAKYYDIWHEDYQDDVRFYPEAGRADRGTGPGVHERDRPQSSFPSPGGIRDHRSGPQPGHAGHTAPPSFVPRGPEVQQRIDMVQGDIREVKLDRKFKLGHHTLQLVPPSPGDQGPGEGAGATYVTTSRTDGPVLLRGVLPPPGPAGAAAAAPRDQAHPAGRGHLLVRVPDLRPA